MQKPNIAVIIGTTRTARFADKPAGWLAEIASSRNDLNLEILDLRDFALPFFDEIASNMYMPSKNERAQQWQQTLARFDGYVFLTAEYNHSVSGALKNALDYAYPEWNRKPAAFVGHGMVGAARAVQHLKDICVELQMVPLKHSVHITGADFRAVLTGAKPLSELTYLEPAANEMLNQLVWWSAVLKTARDAA